eukprot:830584_1
MAEARNQSRYPTPPPFYQLYTSESKNQFESDPNSSEAAHWQPPTPPTENGGKFVKFGVVHTPDFVAHELGPDYEQMFNEDENGTVEPARTLRALLRASLDSYSALLAHLCQPSHAHHDQPKHIAHRRQAAELAHAVSTRIHNARHIVNRLRAHQSRAALIAALREQCEKRTAEAERIERNVEKCKEMLRLSGRTDKKNDSTDGGSCIKMETSASND